MYGSGAGTGGIVIQIQLRQIQQDLSLALTVCCVAGGGTFWQKAFVLPTGITTSPTSGATLSVFVLSALTINRYQITVNSEKRAVRSEQLAVSR